MAADGAGRRDWRHHVLFWPIVVAVVGLIVIGLIEDIPVRHGIEHNLTDRSNSALSGAGLTGFKVNFTGRDGTVYVGSAADSARALSIVRSLEGVRVAKVVVGLPPGSGGSGPLAGGTPTPTVAPAPSSSITAIPTPTGSITPTGSVTPTPTTPSTPTPTQSTDPATGGSATLPQVQTQLNGLTAIEFDLDRAVLTPTGRATVSRVAAILEANPLVHIQIQGNTDGTGAAPRNLVLSRQRALSVYNALRAAGIAANRMTTVGYGETRPKVANDTPAHRAINRRVDFVASAP